MNTKNNLIKFSITFYLLSIFLPSYGKNDPVTETTHQNSKVNLSLNVDPSTKYTIAESIAEHLANTTTSNDELQKYLIELIERKFGASSFLKEFKETLDNLNESVRINIASFNTNLEEIQRNITSLEEQVNALIPDYLDINHIIVQRIVRLQAELTTTQERVRNNQNTIQNLKNEEIKALLAKVLELHLLNSELAYSITKLKTETISDISKLETTVNELQQNIQNLNNKTLEFAVSKIKFAVLPLRAEGFTYFATKFDNITKDNIRREMGPVNNTTSILGFLCIVNKNGLINALQTNFEELYSILLNGGPRY